MITLDDVAKAAGVNKTTVSKAIRGSSDINVETARSIREIAEAMGYVSKWKPEKQLSMDIGIICPEVKSAYYSEIVTILSRLFKERGFNPIVTISDFDGDQEVWLVEYFIEKKAAGLVCLTESEFVGTKLKDAAKDKRIPILQIAMDISSKEYDNICIDEAMAIEYAVRHLVNMGHRKIGFIGDRYSSFRLKYFKEFAVMNGIELQDEYIILNQERHFQCGYQGAESLLKLKDRPTAVIAEYDDVALGIMRRVREAGLRVPEDLSIIGNDNVGYAPYLEKALTTIDGHIDELCAIAVGILERKIQTPEFSVVQSISLKPELLIRETTFRNEANKK